MSFTPLDGAGPAVGAVLTFCEFSKFNPVTSVNFSSHPAHSPTPVFTSS